MITHDIPTIGEAEGQGNTPKRDPSLPAYNPPLAFAKVSPVNRAAHLLACFYSWRAIEICREEGITEEQIARGLFVADAKRDVRAGLRAYYGDPAYGSWPAKAGDDMRDELRKRGLSESEISG